MCSTLDPVLRLEQRGIDPKALGAAVFALIYLTLRPGAARPWLLNNWACLCWLLMRCAAAGVLQGAWDYYVLDRYQRLANSRPYSEVRTSARRLSGDQLI